MACGRKEERLPKIVGRGDLRNVGSVQDAAETLASVGWKRRGRFWRRLLARLEVVPFPVLTYAALERCSKDPILRPGGSRALSKIRHPRGPLQSVESPTSRKRGEKWGTQTIPLTDYSVYGIFYGKRMICMAKNFNTLREKMSPESRKRARALAAKYRAEMPLNELREALEITQVHLARILRVNQAAVSKMERRTDMYVSTLQDFIKAMGGELKITAKFPDGSVEISQFADVKKAAAGKP
jgi:DNA-binding XRE family transcriptional regulator